MLRIDVHLDKVSIMEPYLSTLRNLVIAALSLILPSAMIAAAQDTSPACPERAEQVLVNIQVGLARGQITDGNQVLRTSGQVMRFCSDRTHALAIAAELFAYVGMQIDDPRQKLEIMSAAYESISMSEKAWHRDDVRIVTGADGQEARLYTYGIASKVLSERVMPGLLSAAKGGALHPMFNDEPIAQCPYVHYESARIRSEVEGLAYAHIVKENLIDLAGGRIERLAAACPQQSNYLIYILGEFYARHARLEMEAENTERAVAYAARSIQFLNEFLSSDVLDTSEARFLTSARLSRDHVQQLVLDKVE